MLHHNHHVKYLRLLRDSNCHTSSGTRNTQHSKERPTSHQLPQKHGFLLINAPVNTTGLRDGTFESTTLRLPNSWVSGGLGFSWFQEQMM